MAVLVLLASIMTMVIVQPLLVNSPVDDEEIKLSEFALNLADLEFLEYQETSLGVTVNTGTLLNALIVVMAAILLYQVRILWHKQQDKTELEGLYESTDINLKKMKLERRKKEIDFAYDLWEGKYSNLTFQELMQSI